MKQKIKSFADLKRRLSNKLSLSNYFVNLDGATTHTDEFYYFDGKWHKVEEFDDVIYIDKKTKHQRFCMNYEYFFEVVILKINNYQKSKISYD